MTPTFLVSSSGKHKGESTTRHGAQSGCIRRREEEGVIWESVRVSLGQGERIWLDGRVRCQIAGPGT